MKGFGVWSLTWRYHWKTWLRVRQTGGGAHVKLVFLPDLRRNDWRYEGGFPWEPDPEGDGR